MTVIDSKTAEMIKKDFYENRLTYKEIAQKYRVSFSTISDVLRDRAKVFVSKEDFEELKNKVRELEEKIENINRIIARISMLINARKSLFDNNLRISKM